MSLKKVAIAIAAIAYVGYRATKGGAALKNSAIARGKRILILGAGFGGSEAARELSRLLPENSCEITIVDERDYLLFTPMLTEAVGGDVEAHHIIVPLKHLAPRVRILTGTISEIDLHNRRVTVDAAKQETLTADHLVIALGATANFHHIPGVEENALTLKSLGDAYAIRQNALAMLKAAALEPDAEKRKPLLTFVVAGGGYTGVEAIAALNDLLREKLNADEQLRGESIRMLLVEPLERLMSEITEDLAAYTQVQLENAGIEVKLKTGIKAMNGDEIELTDGERLQARTVIWSAGVEPSPAVTTLEAPKGKNKGLRVDATLAVPGFPGVWAIGDCAAIPDSSGHGIYGATAQNATRQGVHAARNIVRSLRRERLEPFQYRPLGELAVVGRRKAVARVYEVNFAGLKAWCLWRIVYLAKLPSLRQRLRVVSDWTLDALLGPVVQYHYSSTPPRQTRAVQQMGAGAGTGT